MRPVKTAPSVQSAPLSFDEQVARQLEALRTDGFHRSMHRIAGRPGPRMSVDGRDCLMLASSNYLDLAGDPRVVAAAHDAAIEFGTAAGGSRLINGNLALHEAFEAELAEATQFEAALVFSTGYMANVGVITALCGPQDVVISDELNHASIIDGCRLAEARTRVFRHNDPIHLSEVLTEERDRRRRIVVLDGVFSMDGDVADLAGLVPIAHEHAALVVLDDAHGFGILGQDGLGTASHCGVGVDVMIGNLGKALGSFGAFVASSFQVRDLLINTARSFIFTCALAPPALGAARAALRVLGEEPVRARTLLHRSEQLRTGLRSAGYDTGRSETHIVPVIIGDHRDAMALAANAFERGIYAQGIRFPSVPQGTARVRLTPSAGHSVADIASVVDAFADLRGS
jgi:8-amino-7-oxononanoate synthase